MAEQKNDIRSRISALHGEEFASPDLPPGLQELEREIRNDFKIRHADNERVTSAHARIAASFARVLAEDEEALEGMKYLEQIRAARKSPELKLPRYVRAHPQIKSGSIFSVLPPPYSSSWNAGDGNTEATNGGTFGAGEGQPNTGDFGTSAVSGGGTAWGGGGVGTFFSPLPGTSWVEFAPLIQYSYAWLNDSYGFSAHNDGYLGLAAESWDLSFHDYFRFPNQVSQLWSIGTAGWEPTRSQESEGLTSSSGMTFNATSDRYYRLWAYAISSCDATAERGGLITIGSQANNQIICRVPFITINQW
jgi:hypothetical protein